MDQDQEKPSTLKKSGGGGVELQWMKGGGSGEGMKRTKKTQMIF